MYRNTSIGLEFSAASQNPGLPAGISQSNCDGPEDPLADADGPQLWLACEAEQQEAIVADFADAHRDELRDAILELEDRPRPSGDAASLGKQTWQAWIAFRDQSLRELHRRGEIRAGSDH